MPMPKEQQDYVVEFVVDKVGKIKKVFVRYTFKCW